MAKKKNAVNAVHTNNNISPARVKWTRLPGAGLTGWLRFEGGRWRADLNGPALTDEGALAAPETNEIV